MHSDMLDQKRDMVLAQLPYADGDRFPDSSRLKWLYKRCSAFPLIVRKLCLALFVTSPPSVKSARRGSGSDY